MKSTHLRTLAKRMRSLARSRRTCTVDKFYERGPELPTATAVRNFYIRVGTGWFLIACTSRPDEGLRAQLARRKDVREAEAAKRKEVEEQRAWHTDSGGARRSAAAAAETEQEKPRQRRMHISLGLAGLLALGMSVPSKLSRRI